MTVGWRTDITWRARHAGGKNNPAVSKEAPMSQLTSPAPDSPDRHGRLRIWDRFRRAVQEMKFAPVSSELQMVAFSPYYPAGPASF